MSAKGTHKGFTNVLEKRVLARMRGGGGRQNPLDVWMFFDELEEVLDSGGWALLEWFHDHFEDEQVGRCIRGARAQRDKAGRTFQRPVGVDEIDPLYVDSMQWVYCYQHNRPMDKKSRTLAVEHFINGETASPTELIIAYHVLCMLRKRLRPAAGPKGGGPRTGSKRGREKGKAA